MAELRQNKVARALDRRRSCHYNQELQDDCISKKKGKRAFFIIGDSHQDPVCLDVPPAHVWRLKLPNSWKIGIRGPRMIRHVPLGAQRVPGNVIHKFLK